MSVVRDRPEDFANLMHHAVVFGEVTGVKEGVRVDLAKMIRDRDAALRTLVVNQLRACAAVAALQWDLWKIYYPDDIGEREDAAIEYTVQLAHVHSIALALWLHAERLEEYGVVL